MKKEKNPVTIAIIVLAIVLIAIIILYVNPFGNSSNTEGMEATSSSNQALSSIQTIENTLSSSGQVSSGLTENQYLRTGYYFKEFLVTENVLVKEGSNIIEYTNGTYMTAPYDCVVIGTNLPNEDEICSSSHYIQISSTETLSMSLSVSETDINKVEVGDTVDITMTATGEQIKGFITSVSEVGTYSSSGSYFSAIVTFDNNGNQKIGMSATCEIIIESAEDVVAVPVEAIQTSDEGKYVVVINEDGTTTNTIVETGISSDAYIEIKSGINENTKVQLVEKNDDSSNSFGDRINGRGGSMNGFQGGIPSGGPMQGDRMQKMP